MQEIISKITTAELQAQKSKSEAQGNAKSAQLEAVKQGKELVDSTRKRALEASRAMINEAAAKSENVLDSAQQEAEQKAAQLRAGCAENLSKAAQFVVERIIDGI